MDLKNLAEEAISLAKLAGNVLPGVGAGASVAEGILNIVEGLKPHVDTGTAEDLEAAHKTLYDAMTTNGHALSDRLRGG
ncbi:hypothetical protein [Sphingomonas sp. URHD0057]|uniref:hypothetical protein n=1 Tax=Sphingomonas sp. URHD0057 TaxID=1380389 RepID=UPI00048AF40C|nr:hypothetical protein [Sphingomonas sp. URHD0057]